MYDTFEPPAFLADPSDALALLSWCPAYEPTPVRNFPALAASLGWSDLQAKDETRRMGLGSFKALGGVYAVADLVRSITARDGAALTDETTSDTSTKITVCCASAGNHGLSIAAGARIFGAQATVVLADTVPDSFADRLRDKGATVVRHGAVYEDAMAHAITLSQQEGWYLAADSSWPGYTAFPARVMQGYGVMAQEMADNFRKLGGWPTHVALQAGVGGLAAGVAGAIRRLWDVQPEIIVVEPDRAACLKASIRASKLTRADGPVSNMGRLDCKEPSLLAFHVLREIANHFVEVSDAEAKAATALLAEHGITSTPSGAAGHAGMIAMKMPADARPLIIVSEALA
ncbi:MAG TPA: diaminopropionate ammonia-lyase [Octadecabacter sp.]|nr:diaminopropionate ammonia-lyase [Octadecabacter sp.]